MAPIGNRANQRKIRRRRLPYRPPLALWILAGVATVPLLLYAFGGTSSASTTPPGSAQLRAELAYARCMRSHGVLNFPDPNRDGQFPPFQADVSQQISDAAQHACEHLLPLGGGGLITQGDQKKPALALATARCMRTHGFPTYPDPPGPRASGQGSGTRFDGTGIDPKSPRFQRTETACENQARRQLRIPAAK